MVENVELYSTFCAICGTGDNAVEVYEPNFAPESLHPKVFSARRLPDRLHYRIVKCVSCGLTRSDPVVSVSVLADLYRKSTFDYGDEVANLKATYGRYLSRTIAKGENGGALLEIGCGNGFLLEEALARGFERVSGVEPSEDAVAVASPIIRDRIVCDVMRPGLFESATFDVVAMFQVLDHIPDPAELLKECFRVLKPGGSMLCLNHNVDAWSARILRERSPIIDVEHTYLFSPRTMHRILVDQGFHRPRVTTVFNTYTVHYFARLLPLSPRLKHNVLRVLKASGLGQVQLRLPLGNLCAIAQKPD